MSHESARIRKEKQTIIKIIEEDGRFLILNNEIYHKQDETFTGEIKDKQTQEEFFFKIPKINNESETHASYFVKNTVGNNKHLEKLFGEKPFKFGEYFAVIAKLAEGSLKDVLEFGEDFPKNNFEGKKREEQTINLAKQLSLGFKAIHDQGIIHRDVKPSNILIYKPNIWALADLSTSKKADILTKEVITKTHTSAYMYSSFELLDAFSKGKGKKTYSMETDIFGLGATLYQCLQKDHQTIFSQLGDSEINNNADLIHIYKEYVNKLHIREDFKYILRRMMGEKAPRKELSAREKEKYRYTNIDEAIDDLEKIGQGTIGTPLIEEEKKHNMEMDLFQNKYEKFQESIHKVKKSKKGYKKTPDLESIDELINDKEEFIAQANNKKINTIPKRNDLLTEAMDNYHEVEERTTLQINKILDDAQRKYDQSNNISFYLNTLEKCKEIIYVWGKPLAEDKKYNLSHIYNKETEFHKTFERMRNQI